MKAQIKTELNIVSKKKTLASGIIEYHRTCAYCGGLVKFLHSQKPLRCPHCNSLDYVKPEIETQLFLLQELYLKSKKKEAKDIYLSDMYLLLLDYSMSLLKKNLPREFTYSYDRLDEKAEDATNLLIELYLTTPSFKIEKSFAGYLEWKVKEVLWNKKERVEEDHLSFESLYSNGISGDELELSHFSIELQKNLFGDYDVYYKRKLAREELVSGIFKVINTILKTVKHEYAYKDNLLLLIGIWIELNNTTSLIDRNRFYEMYHSNIKRFVDRTLLFIYDYIKESARCVE